MPDSQPNSNQNSLKPLLTCDACGCLCHGFSLENPSQKITGITDLEDVYHTKEKKPLKEFCPLGFQHLTSTQRNLLPPNQSSKEDPSDLIKKAHSLLSQAKSPVMIGFDKCDIQSIQSSLNLARHFRMIADPIDWSGEKKKTLAFCQSGISSCTWGEIGRFPGHLVFWRCDLETASRFLSLIGANKHHQLTLLGDSNHLQKQQQFLNQIQWPIDQVTALEIPHQDFLTLQTLQLIDQNSAQHLEPSEIRKLSGQSQETWLNLLRAETRTHFFFGDFSNSRHSNESSSLPEKVDPANPAPTGVDQATLELSLQIGLNAGKNQRRFTHSFPKSSSTTNTAMEVFTWSTGFPMSVDLRHPESTRFDPTEWDTLGLLADDQSDFVLIIGSDRNRWNSPKGQSFRKQLKGKTVIEIGESQIIPNAAAFLQANWPDHRTAPSIVRKDGVLVPINPISSQLQQDTRRLSISWWVDQILGIEKLA